MAAFLIRCFVVLTTLLDRLVYSFLHARSTSTRSSIGDSCSNMKDSSWSINTLIVQKSDSPKGRDRTHRMVFDARAKNQSKKQWVTKEKTQRKGVSMNNTPTPQIKILRRKMYMKHKKEKEKEQKGETRGVQRKQQESKDGKDRRRKSVAKQEAPTNSR